jgi:hypothetical protein
MSSLPTNNSTDTKPQNEERKQDHLLHSDLKIKVFNDTGSSFSLLRLHKCEIIPEDDTLTMTPSKLRITDHASRKTTEE